jgi:serine/threonine protein kinase
MGLGIDFAAGEPKRRVFGCYEIVAALGRGGMGEVFHARDLRLGRFVALKFLPQASAQDRIAPERIAIDRFFLEARAASALNHPNIVTIYDIGDGTDSRPHRPCCCVRITFSGAAPRLLLVATYRPSELLAGKHPLLQVKLDMQSHARAAKLRSAS